MQRDTLGHSSIQPWSAGALFPAVIAVVETYDDFVDLPTWVKSNHPHVYRYAAMYEDWFAHLSAPFLESATAQYTQAKQDYYQGTLASRLRHTCVELTYPGLPPERYATYDDAAQVARFYIERDAARARHRRENRIAFRLPRGISAEEAAADVKADGSTRDSHPAYADDDDDDPH